MLRLRFLLARLGRALSLIPGHLAGPDLLRVDGVGWPRRLRRPLRGLHGLGPLLCRGVKCHMGIFGWELVEGHSHRSVSIREVRGRDGQL